MSSVETRASPHFARIHTAGSQVGSHLCSYFHFHFHFHFHYHYHFHFHSLTSLHSHSHFHFHFHFTPISLHSLHSSLSLHSSSLHSLPPTSLHTVPSILHFTPIYTSSLLRFSPHLLSSLLYTLLSSLPFSLSHSFSFHSDCSHQTSFIDFIAGSRSSFVQSPGSFRPQPLVADGCPVIW